MRFNTYLRWVGWAFLFGASHPELASSGHSGNHANIIPSIVLFIITGILLETCYRFIAWGGLNLRESHVRGNSPVFARPWTLLDYKYPDTNIKVEFLFDDGKVRIGMICINEAGNKTPIIEFPDNEMKHIHDGKFSASPTHWRVIEKIRSAH